MVSSKKEKVIVATLLVVFVTLLSFVLTDLYGRKALSNYICTSQNVVSDNSSQASSVTPSTGAISGTTNPTNNLVTPVTTNEQSTNKKTKPTTTTDQKPKQDSNVAYTSYSTCLENTKDGPAAKDCCDCLSADVSVRKACRDATVDYDFSKNTSIKTFPISSKLGRTGDYSSYTASGNAQTCKQQCDTSATLACGDYQFCRTACDSLAK